LSVGIQTALIWKIKVNESSSDDKSQRWNICLEPQLTVYFPHNIADSVLMTSLSDRICMSRPNNSISVFAFGNSYEKHVGENKVR